MNNQNSSSSTTQDFNPEDIEIIQITDNDLYDEEPSISGNNIVWEQGQNIVLHNLDDGTTKQITTGNARKLDPSISDNSIVWAKEYDDFYEIYHDIFLHNLNDGTTGQITNNSNDSEPSISGNKIVWERGFYRQTIDNDEEIFLYDINTNITSQITNNNLSDEAPSISGNNIVWEQEKDIVLHNLSDGTTRQITNSGQNYNPSISDNNIVWEQGKGNIFLHNLSDSTTRQITHSGDDSNPSISGNKIVWERYLDNDEEIFLATLPNEAPIAVNDPENPDEPLIVNVGESITIDVLANDSDPNEDTLTIESVGEPTSGTAIISNSQIIYKPDDSFKSKDSFTYTINDGNGNTGSATVEVQSCPNTGNLNIEVAGKEFKDTDGDGDCDAQGTIYIGRDDGIERMLRVEGTTAEHDENSLTLTAGTVYSEIGGVTEALFEIDGSLEIPFDDPTTTVSETGNSGERFQLAGLDVNVNELTIQSNRFRLGGDFVLPEEIVGKELPIPLENLETVIFKQDEISLGASGKVDFPDVEFKLLNLLEVEAENVSISYKSPTDTIQIQGILELESLVKSLQPELTVDLTEPNLIQIKDGKVDGIVTLAVEDVKPAKGWEIGAAITLDTVNDEVKGKGSFVFPFSSKSTKGKKKQGGLDLELGFKTELSTQLDTVVGKVILPGIPVGTTGFFLNEINGGLNHLAPSNNQLVEFSGDVKLTGGKKPLKVIDLDLAATINAEQATGQGTISIIDPAIIQGTTQATLNWNAETFSATNNVSILGGLLEGTTSLQTDSSFNFVMRGTATLNVPFFIPRIGGESIAGTELLLKFSNDNDLANDFVQASTSISNPLGSITGQEEMITVGIRQSLAGGLPEFLGNEVPITGSWDVVTDTSYLLVSANWENLTDANTPIQVIDNNGNVIAESDFAANNIAVVEDLTDENTKTVIIANPEAGRWDVELVSTEGLGEVTYFATRDSDAPTIDVIEPSQTVPGGEVEITFDAFDADSEANISLFYDDDGEGFDGIQIVDGLIEQDGRGNYTWNTAGVAIGEYHIYAMALDDTNAPVFSYSPGTVQITEAADLSVSQTVDLESVNLGEEQTYTVTVTNNGEDDSQGVNLTYVLPEGTTFVSATVNPSEQNDNNLTFDLGDLANGETSNIEITVNASNVVGDNLSNAIVNSNTYDPDFTNDAVSLTTTVTNNQSLPEFSITDISVAEGNDNKIDAVFTVSVSEALEETIKVDYTTEDYTAIASEDYLATNGTLEFAPGETEKTITVEVIGDTDFEPEEIFLVDLSNPVDSAIADSQGIGTINNDDVEPQINLAIDNITVDEDANNSEINLSNSLENIDREVVFNVLANDNESLVTAGVEGSNLTLDYQDNQFGTAEITVRAISDGETVEDSFTVTVNPIDDAPIVSNPISNINVNENSDSSVIDLSDTFTDIDNDDADLVKTVSVNSNEDLATASIDNNNLTLDYQENSFGTAEITIEGESNGQTITDSFTVTVQKATYSGEYLVGSELADELKGGQGNDSIFGGKGDDSISGREGNDFLIGLVGKDSIAGEEDDDFLVGYHGNDTISGGEGNDLILGNQNDDILYGDAGNDLLSGGTGDDMLFGGLGDDTLWGKEGSDIYVLELDRGQDLIQDFTEGEDLIGLGNDMNFNGLTIIGDSDAQIVDSDDNILAVLSGVNASTISEDSFITV